MYVGLFAMIKSQNLYLKTNIIPTSNIRAKDYYEPELYKSLFS